MPTDETIRPLVDVPNLRDALHRARSENAERAAAIADLRETELARLEILRDALEPVFNQIPDGAELFDHGLTPGETPRLYVDILAYVELARDKRSYRFVRDTRWGQKLIAETDRLQGVVDAVANYIAARLIEREKALRSDALASLPPDPPKAASPLPPDEKRSSQAVNQTRHETKSEQTETPEPWLRPMLIGLVCLMAGISLGAGALLALGALKLGLSP